MLGAGSVEGGGIEGELNRFNVTDIKIGIVYNYWNYYSRRLSTVYVKLSAL